MKHKFKYHNKHSINVKWSSIWVIIHSISLFIIGFLQSFILSIYAFDWGRWIAINNVCFFMFLLSFQKQKDNNSVIFINNKLFYLSLFPFLFRMPQCCVRPYEDYFLITYILDKFYKLKEIIILYI